MRDPCAVLMCLGELKANALPEQAVADTIAFKLKRVLRMGES